tara:strand:+ start:495 stop:695 length:201 start_codon:yes stop_codon:yes gene_type:complete
MDIILDNNAFEQELAEVDQDSFNAQRRKTGKAKLKTAKSAVKVARRRLATAKKRLTKAKISARKGC